MLHLKSSIKVDAQNVVNIDINQVTRGLLSHNHRDMTKNTVYFEKTLETQEVPNGKVGNLKLSEVPIGKIGNDRFQDLVGSVLRRITGGLTAQK